MTPPPTASPLPSRPGFSWSRLGRLAGKELRESLRDRRTLLTLVLMPILLYPLLGLVFFHFFRSPLLALRETTYRLGLRNKKEAGAAGRLSAQGRARHGARPGFCAAP